MLLESALVPIPSEVVLPFGGFLASSGQLSFWLVVVVATLANLTGSLVIYCVGYFGGRPLLEKYGKYVLVHRDEVAKLDSWLDRYGASAAFFSRLLPGIRGFSSIVIGAGKVGFKKFFWYTLFGSLIWNFLLAYVGYVTGGHWNFLRPYFRKFELLIGAAILIGAVLFVVRHWRKNRR